MRIDVVLDACVTTVVIQIHSIGRNVTVPTWRSRLSVCSHAPTDGQIDDERAGERLPGCFPMCVPSLSQVSVELRLIHARTLRQIA